MAADTSMIHVRMDNALKAKATEALAALGLSTSDAVRLLFHRIAADQAFPLELKVPNAETRAAMREADAFFKTGGKAQFANSDEMFAELEKNTRK
jgi:DNA-damage-inducible protein J